MFSVFQKQFVIVEYLSRGADDWLGTSHIMRCQFSFTWTFALDLHFILILDSIRNYRRIRGGSTFCLHIKSKTLLAPCMWNQNQDRTEIHIQSNWAPRMSEKWITVFFRVYEKRAYWLSMLIGENMVGAWLTVRNHPFFTQNLLFFAQIIYRRSFFAVLFHWKSSYNKSVSLWVISTVFTQMDYLEIWKPFYKYLVWSNWNLAFPI